MQGGSPSPGPVVRVPYNISTMLCEQCHWGSHEDQILICDSCDKGWHIWCLRPPLSSVPPADESWICQGCAANLHDGSNSFEAGPVFTLKLFEKMANGFRDKWLEMASHQVRLCPSTFRMRGDANEGFGFSVVLTPLPCMGLHGLSIYGECLCSIEVSERTTAGPDIMLLK